MVLLSHNHRRQWFGVWLLSSMMTPAAALHLAMSSSSASSASPQSWKPPSHWTFTGFRSATGAVLPLHSTSDEDEEYLAGYYDEYPSSAAADGAIFPDGGLSPCVIKVIGVGGGGSNAVDRMLDTAVGGVDFWAINTDAQALGRSKAKGAKVLNIGAAATRGLGAGGNPEIGRLAVRDQKDIAVVLFVYFVVVVMAFTATVLFVVGLSGTE